MKIVRMLPVRDEADILEANLRWYADRGIETVALDDGSSDGSAEVLRMAEREGQIARLERIEVSPRHELAGRLERLQELAAELAPDALMLTAADEFFEVGDGSDLARGIEADLAAGYTVLEFKNMEFQQTARDDPEEADPLRRLRFYSLWDVKMYRCARWAPGIDFGPRLGHKPELPQPLEWRPSPRLYVSRHYPLRSPEQSARKIARIQPHPERPRAHSHYLPLVHGEGDPRVPVSVLNRYEEDHQWVLEQTLLPFKLTQTRRALARAHLRIEELERQLLELERDLPG